MRISIVIKDDTDILISIIGIRYELGDEYICAMGSLQNKLIGREDKKTKN